MKIEKMVWAVIVVSVIQTLVIIYLVSGISHLNQAVSMQSNLFFKAIESQSKSKNVSSQVHSTEQQGIDVTLLKQTIQQELNQYFQQHPTATVSSSPNRTLPPKVSSPENIQRVDDQLDLIIAEGGMSNNSFESFSAEVSKLTPQERRIALSRLAKAINNGQVITTN